MSSIGEIYNRLGKTFLTLLVGNHWVTGGLRVKRRRIVFLLFLLEGDAILPMIPRADCDTQHQNIVCKFLKSLVRRDKQ